VGSDRAAITLRDDWRQDLIRWHTEAGLKQVRFHGIFNDELGVDAPSILSRGVAQLNFQNIDRVYGGLLARGVSPYVELSFMPKKLASADRKFGAVRCAMSCPDAASRRALSGASASGATNRSFPDKSARAPARRSPCDSSWHRRSV
jgi:Glycosyl hydrolases family 39